jgi:hypothetical protein
MNFFLLLLFSHFQLCIPPIISQTSQVTYRLPQFTITGQTTCSHVIIELFKFETRLDVVLMAVYIWKNYLLICLFYR